MTDDLPEPPLPWPGLLVLVAIAFIAVLSELMPAGLLTPMAEDLGVRESAAGGLVTAYAFSSGVATIPVIALTRSVSRYRLMLVTTLGFGVVSLLTAVIGDYALMIPVRLAGGVFTGILWTLVGSYAAALVGPEQRGRAVSIGLGGATIGFSVGLPAATALGQAVGWRGAFGVLAAVSFAAAAGVVFVLPHVAGEPEEGRLPFVAVLRLPGIAAISAVVVAMVVGHYAMYTYIDPFSARTGLESATSLALLLFGGGSVVGIWLTSRIIDRHLRAALLLELGVIVAVLAVFGVDGTAAAVLLAGALVWGLAYGGISPIMQTAASRVAGPAADVAISVVVTAWSFGIAAGALVGGLTLDGPGLAALPWVAAAFLAAAWAGVAVASRHAFPRTS